MMSPTKTDMPADSGRINVEKSIGHGRAICKMRWLYSPGSQFTHEKFTPEKLVPSKRDMIERELARTLPPRGWSRPCLAAKLGPCGRRTAVLSGHRGRHKNHRLEEEYAGSDLGPRSSAQSRSGGNGRLA